MHCYTEEQLRAFAIGRLDGDSAEAIGRHLEQCPACEDTVAALDDATDSLLRELRHPVTVSSVHAADSVFQRAQRQVENDPFLPLQHSSTPTPDRDITAGVPQQLRDYQLVEPLGQGGMGTVYRALHLRLNRQVAFKILPERRLRDSLAVARFQREMQTIGQMNHPAIVRAMDAGEVAGQHYLAMELVEGVDLGRLARHCGPLAIGAACELMRQAAIGLEYVHTSGIVHRDIKPSNVMLDRQGYVKILDLGLALLDGVHGATDELTTVGQLMGTLDYMAPEQFQDSHDVDRRADIYGLSATLYKLLTGHAPYAGPQGRTPLQKLKALATEPVPPIRGRRSEIPEELAAAIHRGLDHAPERRPETAAAWAAAIGHWAEANALPALIAEFDTILREAVHIPPSPTVPPIDSSHIAPSPSAAWRADAAEQPAMTAMATTSSAAPPRGWRARLLGLAAGAAAIFCGWILYVETDKGQLVIQCPADNVELQFAQEGQPSDTATLRAGDNTLRLRSGDYTLSLTGNVRGLRLEEGQLHVTRGKAQSATIVATTTDRTPAAGMPATASNAKTPRYSGKSFDEWLDLLQTERDVAEQYRALVALARLSDVRGGQEVMRIMLQHAQLDHWKEAELYSPIASADREAGMRSALETGTTEERLRALNVLCLTGAYPPLPDTDQHLLVPFTHDPELHTSARDALARVVHWDGQTKARFAELARDDDPAIAFHAAMLLAAHEQQPTDVAALLTYLEPDAVSLENPARRHRMIEALKVLRLLTSKEIAPQAAAQLSALLNSGQPDLFAPVPQGDIGVLPSEPVVFELLVRRMNNQWGKGARRVLSIASLAIMTLDVLTSQAEEAVGVLKEFVDSPTHRPELLAINGFDKSWRHAASTLEQVYRSASTDAENRDRLLGTVDRVRERLEQLQAVDDRATPAAEPTVDANPTPLVYTPAQSPQSAQTDNGESNTEPASATVATHSYEQKSLDEWLNVAMTSTHVGADSLTDAYNVHHQSGTVLTAIRTLARNESAEVRNSRFALWQDVCRQELSPSRLGFNLCVLSALSVDDRSQEALAAIFESLDRMSGEELDMGNLFTNFAKHINDALHLLPPELVRARVEEALLHGNFLTRSILLYDTRFDATEHLEGLLAASQDTRGAVAQLALEKLRILAPVEPTAKQRLEAALEDPALRFIAAHELFFLEMPQGTFEQAAKLAESRDARQAILGLAGLLRFGRQQVSKESVEDGIVTAEQGIAWLLDQEDWGAPDPQRPLLDPRAFAILGVARNIDPDLAAALLDKHLPNRVDIRQQLLKLSSPGGR